MQYAVADCCRCSPVLNMNAPTVRRSLAVKVYAAAFLPQSKLVNKLLSCDFASSERFYELKWVGIVCHSTPQKKIKPASDWCVILCGLVFTSYCKATRAEQAAN